ncbi:MAG: hypothetical protein IKT09_05055 [Synergistes sp.]|nr:hypothetical protein [Synergistes sp.]
MTRAEKIREAKVTEMARLLKPLFCDGCPRLERMGCPNTNRDNDCWALILDWLMREVPEI